VRLAAIDLGSNSVHMVVADMTADGRIQVVDRVKEMVRLGRKAFTTGALTEETTELAVRAVTTFGRLARQRAAVAGCRDQRCAGEGGPRSCGGCGARRAPSWILPLTGPAPRCPLRDGLEGEPYLLVDAGGGSVG
jgi:hypothetical protein